MTSSPDAGPGARPDFGGKALLRLLQLLESAGLREPAARAVYAAVPDAAAAEFAAAVAPQTADPSGEPVAALMGVPTGRKAGVTSKQIARTYAEAAEQLMGPDPQDQSNWKSLGPTTIPNGQTYGTSRVNVSGRIAAIAVDPSDGAHVLAGAAHGGVWESHDRGASWAPRTDDARTLTVGALTYDPRDPAVAYCGTGEGNWWKHLGTGILRSGDGGTTWDVLCTDPFVGQGFFDLKVNPRRSSRLIAATDHGLWTSADGGVNWTQARTAATWSVSIAPNGREVLAGCQDGVFRSADGGGSWAAVSLPGAPPSYARLAVAIAPSKARTAYAWGASGTQAYLWRRSGTNWGSVAVPPQVNVKQAWYDWFLAVAPDNDKQVFLGAISGYRGDLSGAQPSWVDIVTRQVGDSIHPDEHAIAFEPNDPNAIYVGNDGGMFRSPDRGDTWKHLNNGLAITEFEFLAQRPTSPRWLIGGTQDNGTERWTGKSIWTHVADGDGGDCGVDQSQPDTVFFSRNGFVLARSTTGGDLGSYTNISPQVPQGESALFYAPFETSADGEDTIAFGGGALYVSRDNGTTWTRLPYPSDALTSAMYIPRRDSVYVGTTDGRVFRARFSGSSWSLTALTTPRSGATVSDLWVHPKMRQIWATYRTIGGGRVFRSSDGGSSWTDRTSNLLDLPINAIAVSADPDRLWVAADLGVYETTDTGGSWHSFSNGLPNMFVGDLLYHEPKSLLRAGTRNRGVWQTAVT